MNSETFKEKLLSQIEGKEYITFSTCDFKNWDKDEHYSALKLAGEWPEGYTLSYKINYGVHDWTLLKNQSI